jgi:hypothetical protein
MEEAWASLTAVRAKSDSESLELKEAERAYYEAVEEYKSTPDGLEELLTTDPESHARYAAIREFQMEALSEVKQKRVGKITALASMAQTFYDEEEMESVLDSVRRVEERKMLNFSDETTKEDKKNAYFSMLNNYENQLKEQGTLDSHSRELLQELRSMKPPREIVSLNTYSAFLSYLPQSKDALRKEIQKIAVMQDVSPKVAAAYHDAYRAEYNRTYSQLPVKNQPNPAKECVEGSYTSTGFKNDSSTMLAPADPATLYATYRLRSDPKAIPDYLKNSRILASAHLDTESNEIGIVLFNNKGKEIERFTTKESTPHLAADKLNGKIIIMDTDPASRSWLVGLNKKIPLNSSMFSTTELSSKHLDLPDNSLVTLCQATGVKERDGLEGKSESVLQAYFSGRQQITKNWRSKAARRDAPPLDELPLTSRWA